MSSARSGILAMIGACAIWGLSPIFYRQLAEIPPWEVLAHRALWSLILFAGILWVQGRLGEVRAGFSDGRRARRTVLAAAMVSANWFLFILATQIDRVTESSLGYYIYPLVAVLIGRFAFGERLGPVQWTAVGLAALAVGLLTWGLGVAPWLSLVLAGTFGIYGAIKKTLPLGPMVSVVAEILVFLPLALGVLVVMHAQGIGAFGPERWRESLLLILSGPITALPMILFSFAARRVAMSTVGLLQYINPSLQFICAIAVFGEVLTFWHGLAFPMIWTALTLYSLASLRQERRARRVAMASSTVPTTVMKPSSEASAKP